jgi:RNA polymerase sigma-70 factor (ECF subfamily)
LEALTVRDTVPGAEETVAAAQRARSLRNALHALPEEQSAILRLSYFGGRSQTEIAHVLGLPLGTVKSRVRLALMRLREALGEDPT